MHSFRRYYRGRVKKFQTKLLYVAFRCSHTTAGMKWIDDDDEAAAAAADDVVVLNEWDEMDEF